MDSPDPEYIDGSSEAKPRLKWTPQLHQRFVDAVLELGGASKATPKSIMKAMGIPGITLYHLKSHLQKYRLAMNHDASFLGDNNRQDSGNATFSRSPKPVEHTQEQHFNENMLRAHMEAQRELLKQIEVRQHLQLRIEAQGRYLQSVLNQVQQILVEHECGASTARKEAAKAELSDPDSTVETECLSLPSFLAAEAKRPKRPDSAGCSTDSCVTSIEGEECAGGEKRQRISVAFQDTDRKRKLLCQKEDGDAQEDKDELDLNRDLNG